MMQIAQRLERIADIATNIAEDVIFLAEGRVVRHED
jgi:phosphate transport system protein